jgi:transposase
VKGLVDHPPPGATVLYTDQSDVGLHPDTGNEWSPPGKQTEVPTHGKNHKTHLFGVLDAHPGQLHVGFWPHKDSDAFIDFLRDLLEHIPQGPIHLVADNYIIHMSRKTSRFLASPEATRITLHFLPTYSPWLNPIEGVWRIIRARAGTNRWRDTLDQVHRDFNATMAAMGADVMAPSTNYTSEEGPT